MLFAASLVALVAGVACAQEAGETKEEPRPQQRQRPPAPKVGQEAPLFKLASLDGKKETDLKSFRGQRPVILFFGSYT
jgi:cytochrome oxidase Cu insertion factor (SCO1/SenC/PrrC family)